jgi:hypothetical protein
MMKITLIAVKLENGPTYLSGLGIASLSVWLRERAQLPVIPDIREVYIPHHLGSVTVEDCFIDEILKNNPDIVGFSCFLGVQGAIFDLAQRIKAKAPDVTIVAGGPYAAFFSREILHNNPGIDVIVRGEGEVPFSELIARYPGHYKGIKGISCRDNGRIMEYGNAFHLQHLSDLPSPYHDKDMPLDQNYMFVEAYRVSLLHFRVPLCVSDPGGSRKIRTMPVAKLREELRFSVEHDMRMELINLASTDIPAFMDFMDLAAKYHGRSPMIRVFILREFFDPQAMKKLAKYRFLHIRAVVQTFVPSSLRNLFGIELDKSKFTESLRIAADMGKVGIELMVGIPGENLSSFKKSVDFLMDLHKKHPSLIAEVDAQLPILFPDSMWADNPARFGIKKVAPIGVPYILATETFNESDMEQAMKYLAELRHELPLQWISSDSAGISLQGSHG